MPSTTEGSSARAIDKGVRRAVEKLYRRLLGEIFERAGKQGTVPAPEQAMRELAERLAPLCPPSSRDEPESDGEAARNRTDGMRLWRAAYHYAVDCFFDAAPPDWRPRRGRPPLSPEQLAEVARLSKEGKSNTAIARKLGITREAVLKRKKRAGRTGPA